MNVGTPADRSPTRQSTAHWFRRSLYIVLILLAITFVGFGGWLLHLNSDIKQRFAEKRFAPPVEFFSAPERIEAGMTYPANQFTSLFARKNFRRRDFGQPLQTGDYSEWSGEQCRSMVPATNAALNAPPPGSPAANSAPPASIERCIAFRNSQPENSPVQIIALEAATDHDHVSAVFTGAPPVSAPVVEIEPELFAQYYGDKPVLREIVSLGTVPTNCLNGLIAIEDSSFLEHSGVSYRGLGRAVLTVLKPGRRAEGGSTITQQLVKNYFLTDERTLKRKLTEIPMAFLVEQHATKDEILETYINLIYMGQNGPFQVRGFAAASRHYFGKPIGDLDLEQCALLVGILNNPGYFNPFHNPDHAKSRRTKVLDRMLTLNMINEEQAKAAKSAPLPNLPERALTEPAPYYVQAVRRELAMRGIDETQGLRVYTSLNLRAQETAHQSLRAGLDRLETKEAWLKKNKTAGKNLEGLLISADPRTGAVEALVGGRGYLVTQFNRATDSRRQVGSIMKPFVYLTAFESRAPNGQPYTPLTLVADKSTTIKYEGQTWTPHNFEPEFHGDIPLFWALKESINAATVNLGMDVGLPNIIDTARRLGVASPIQPVPSLTLGAFELSPIEVLQAYSAIANMGQKVSLTLLQHVDALSGQELYRYSPQPQAAVAADSTAELVGAMKQTLFNGTARGARLSGFTRPAAGKTGTTNDKKDTWFSGFTPYHAAIVWVGYDDNTPVNLTGGTGAVPIWTTYMKGYAEKFPEQDFPWPSGVEKVTLSQDQQISFGVPSKIVKGEAAPLEPIELIFKQGQSPVPANAPGTAPFGFGDHGR